ncbi:hypothetical protein [Deinococcus multiflagellatus]|uniref:Uncharacterized protein n=1 Tax=Deinococcus multiflagellatus TaxID=1656887 RepID=A0ABW1ZIE0_9DEIO|nr:hypothetical protein [Deinococcus multiflagellatus]MBZ9713801.1 hypothetical protein [Deinococcus multiflagellatus]
MKLLYSKVREEGWSEEVTSPEKTTEVGVDLGGSVEGKLAALAGMTGEIGADWKHGVKVGGDSRTDHERRATADLFGLHHRAFDLVMERVGHRFTTVHGKIFLLDFDWAEKKVKDFPEIIKAVKPLADPSTKLTTPPNTTQMSYLLRSYMKGKTLVILRSQAGQKYTAYLETRHLLTPIEDLIDAYGQAPTLDFTLVGIAAPPQRYDQAGDFSVAHFQPDGQALAGTLANFAGSLSNMRDFFNVKSTQGHLVPLALYLEI